MSVPRFWRMGSMIIDRENEWAEIGNYQDIAIEVLKLRRDNADLLTACKAAKTILDVLRKDTEQFEVSVNGELKTVDVTAFIIGLEAIIARAGGELTCL